MTPAAVPAPLPMVGIVVVNYFGGELTTRCLASLEHLTWPADRLAVALVDNGSPPGYLDDLRLRFPSVRVVEAGANLGFGGGCNLGFEALRDCSYVALLNNDAVPEPGWLEPLVEALEADPRLGAATPKVLLAGRFVGIELRSPTVRPGGGDHRALGVQLCGARVDAQDVSGRVELVSGFWGWEHDAITVGGAFAWTDGAATARLPVDAAAERVERVDLRLACGHGRTEAEVVVGDTATPVVVDIRPEWVTVDGAAVTELINNVGTVLRPDGATADRGYLEPDDGRYDEPAEVFAWSGAAVLLRRTFLDDVGAFDPRYFLYSEDADLSWRGRLRGWSYRYEPRSTVRHDHSATVGQHSPLVRHLAERNRLLLLTKCAPRALAVAAVGDLVRRLLTALHRDLLLKALHLQRPVLRHVRVLVRILAGFAQLAPGALADRRRLARGRVVSDHGVTGWLGACR